MNQSNSIRVFLSSRMDEDPDIGPFRVALKNKLATLQRLGFTLDYEDRTTPADSDTALQASLRKVRQADIVILLMDNDPTSYTAEEWQEADNRGTPILEYFLSTISSEQRTALANAVLPNRKEKPIYDGRTLSPDRDPEIVADEIIFGLLERAINKGWLAAERFEEEPLASEIYRYCYLLGQNPTDPQQDFDEDNSFSFTATVEADDHGKTCLYYCTENLITIEKIERLKSIARSRSADLFHIITNRTFDELEQSIAAEYDGLLDTPCTFVLRYLKIEDDFSALEQDSDRRGVDETYIPLEYSLRGADGSERPGHKQSIDDNISEWLSNSGTKHLAILGEFGAGKSWLCLHTCTQLLERVKEQFDPTARIPLLIQLGKVANRAPASLSSNGLDHTDQTSGDTKNYLIQHISELLRRENRSSDNAFVELILQTGRLLVVLDGFDELGIGLTPHERNAHLRDIQDLAIGKNKIILTSRTSYFVSTEAEHEELQLDSAGQNTTATRFEFDIVHLADLTTRQMITRIRSEFDAEAEDLWRRIETTPNLISLVRRPIVLDMVLGILKTNPDDIPLTLFDIYQACSKEWLKHVRRGSTADAIEALERDPHASVMMDLAWHLYGEGEKKVELSHDDEIARFSDRQLEELFDDLENRFDLSTSDITGQTFLIRDGEGNFKFVHRSFMEFFVALRIRKEIQANDFISLGAKNLTDGVATFLQHSGMDKPTFMPILDSQRQSNLDVGSFASKPALPWLAGNVLTVLCRLDNDMRDLDFKGLWILDADLSNARLNNVDFSGSVLNHVRLNGADLSGADWRNAYLDNLLLGVKSAVKCVACSPVEAKAAYTNSMNEVLLIDLADPSSITRLGAHNDAINYLRFSEDGKSLASIGFGQELKIWSTATSKLENELSTTAETDYAVALIDTFGGNKNVGGDRYILTGGTDGVMRVFSKHNEEQVLRVRDHKKTIYCIATEPLSRQIATASFDNTIKIYRYKEERFAFRASSKYPGPRKHANRVNGIAFQPGGAMLASTDNDGIIYVWMAKGRDFASKARKIHGHDNQIWSIQFSHSGAYAVTASTDRKVKVWSVADDWKLLATLSGHKKTVWNAAFAYGDETIVSCSQDGTVRFWDWKNEKERQDPIPVGETQDKGLIFNGLKIGGAKGLSPLQDDFLSSDADISV